MELKPGYKNTEAGVIPEDWEVLQLGEVAEIRMCKRIFAEQTNPNSGIPFFKIGTFGGEPDAFIPQKIYKEYKEKYSFPQKGDILLSAAGTLGKTVVYDGADAYFQDSNIVWLDINHHKIANEYLYYCYQNIKWVSPEGSTISRLYNGIIKSTKIILPPLSEQRAIAQALSDVDALLAAQEQLIAKKRDLKQAAMQQLLTGKTRLPGFSGEWECVPLGDYATFRTGPFGSALHKSDYTTCGVPIINPMHIVDGKIVASPSMTVTDSTAKRLSDFHLSVNDIIIGRRGEMGRCAVIQPHQSGWLCGTGSMIIKLKNADAAFVQRLLSSQQTISYIENLSVGSTMINLNQGTLSALKFLFPSLPEQTAIAAVLSDMDTEISALEARRDKARALKHAMMQELLTGKTRLV